MSTSYFKIVEALEDGIYCFDFMEQKVSVYYETKCGQKTRIIGTIYNEDDPSKIYAKVEVPYEEEKDIPLMIADVMAKLQEAIIKSFKNEFLGNA